MNKKLCGLCDTDHTIYKDVVQALEVIEDGRSDSDCKESARTWIIQRYSVMKSLLRIETVFVVALTVFLIIAILVLMLGEL